MISTLMLWMECPAELKGLAGFIQSAIHVRSMAVHSFMEALTGLTHVLDRTHLSLNEIYHIV